MDSPTRAGEGDVPEAVDVMTTVGIAGVGDKALVGAALGVPLLRSEQVGSYR